ncbi:MAG TPA: DUF1080 domain-containing protein [Phycisphaerae bacterium]|nr:DUF1080 domain-containing protein [Phycisphaerae bacterium]HRY68538.1 DUF1080 domain-containing protein [Phycisphaerae bacterium]HSA25586.1 DUF1080 domain-containing protein [Phycisphaerae bacterium]
MAKRFCLSMITPVSVLAFLYAVPPVGVAREEGQVLSPPLRVDKIRLLIVTGGHGFERDPFFAMFKAYPDMTFREVKQPEALKWYTAEKSREYDVLVWYDLWDNAKPGDLENLKALLDRGKPLVALHHSIANYQDWPEAIKILGGKFYTKPAGGRGTSTWKEGIQLKIRVGDPNHPVTRFMKDYDILDEGYGEMELLPGTHPLLTTENPHSDKSVAWAHTYGKSAVVYIQGGHDHFAFENPNYRRLVGQAIRFVAGRLPDPSEKGFEPIFNGKDLDGWTVVADRAGFVVKDGILRSDSGKNGQWLRYNRELGDFVLRVEWRVSKDGNAGVFIRSKAEGNPWETGHEIQISNQPRDEMHCTGSMYGRVPVDPRPDESPDVWHEFEIQCRGPRIKVFADNVPVIDVDQSKVESAKGIPLKGFIGLQDSHNPSGWIEYRKVMLKELKGEKSVGPS